MDEVQKNESSISTSPTNGKPPKENKPKKELTPQQVQQRRKMIVFPLMFLAFAGCMYLIFAPSGKEDVNVESVGGLNADIPLPAEDGIIAVSYTHLVRSCRSHSSVLLPYCGLFKGLILLVVSLPCNGSCLMCSICSRLPSRFPML